MSPTPSYKAVSPRPGGRDKGLKGTYSERITPELNMSLAKIVPNGLETKISQSTPFRNLWIANLGTCEYAMIISSDVAWKSNSRPVFPAAIPRSKSAMRISNTCTCLRG